MFHWFSFSNYALLAFMLFYFDALRAQDCVRDVTPPVLKLKSEIGVRLEPLSAYYPLKIEEIDLGSYDDCDSSFSISFSSEMQEDELWLDLNDIGRFRPVWVFGRDKSGNRSYDIIKVHLRHSDCEMDTVAPYIKCINVWIDLNQEQEITPRRLISNSLYDYCSIPLYAFDQDFNVSKLKRELNYAGKTEELSVFAKDFKGNLSSCISRISYYQLSETCLRDTIPPKLKCLDSFIVTTTHRNVKAEELIKEVTDPCGILSVQFKDEYIGYRDSGLDLYQKMLLNHGPITKVVATDFKNNQRVCEVNLKLTSLLPDCTSDSTSPYLRCGDGYKIYTRTDSVLISANQFVFESWDDCILNPALSFSRNWKDSMYMIRRTQAGEVLRLPIFAIDASGNTDSCLVHIFPIDRQGCDPDTSSPLIQCPKEPIVYLPDFNQYVYSSDFIFNAADQCSYVNISFDRYGKIHEMEVFEFLNNVRDSFIIYALDMVGHVDSCLIQIKPVYNKITNIPINVTEDILWPYSSKYYLTVHTTMGNIYTSQQFTANERNVSISHRDDESIKSISIHHITDPMEENQNITTADILFFSRMMLEEPIKQSLVNVYLMDADCNDSLDIRDMYDMRSYILGDSLNLPCITQREVFFTDSFLIAIGNSIQITAGSNVPTLYIFSSYRGNFYSVSARKNHKIQHKKYVPEGDPDHWIYRDQMLQEGDSVWLNFRFSKLTSEFTGMQGTIVFDSAKLTIDSVRVTGSKIVNTKIHSNALYYLQAPYIITKHDSIITMNVRARVLRSGLLSSSFKEQNEFGCFSIGTKRSCKAIEILKEGFVNQKDDTAIENLIQVYPNPAHSAFIIELNDPNLSIEFLELRDFRGKSIWKKTGIREAAIFSVRNLPTGMYTLYGITNSGIKFSKKLMIQS